ncbi:MAG: PEP-CTERM sorting domain-containing protein [Bacteroidetes bacterium]|nr:PEP-CTERM sorting domain-containing protein [Bacteroidota bacterium]
MGSSGGFTTLNLMAVPEPSVGALFMFGLGGLLLTRMFRRTEA